MCCFQGEIDAREDSFRSALESGKKLVESDHYAAEEVKEKVRSFMLTTICKWTVYLTRGKRL